MTPQETNIAIVEHLGWTYISSRCMWGLPPGAEDCGTENCLIHFPNYYGDLNSIIPVIRALPEKDFRKFCLDVRHRHGDLDCFAPTAPNLCEALIRIIEEQKERK